MADSRRWNGTGVRRSDQFVRPPAFRDEHESDHLAPEAAAWHGSGSRQVALAAVLAIAAGMAAVAFMFLVAPDGSGIGAQDPVAAEEGPGPVDGAPTDVGQALVDLGDVTVPPAASAGNATSIPVPALPVP